MSTISTITIAKLVKHFGGAIPATLKPVCSSCGGLQWVDVEDPGACHYQAECPVCTPVDDRWVREADPCAEERTIYTTISGF